MDQDQTQPRQNGEDIAPDGKSDALGSLPWWLTKAEWYRWWAENVPPDREKQTWRRMRITGTTTVEAARWEKERE